MPAFFSVGHSNRSLPEFIGLIQGTVTAVADVRAIPRSRAHPQFNIETLPAALAAYGIGYEHIPDLGGRRRRIDPDSPNDFWEHTSFRNYADYAATPDFRRGLDRLRMLGQRQPCAMMCAEAVWWRCHRRIIADYLIAAGETVFHILSPARIEPATLTPAARKTPQGTLIYQKPADGLPAHSLSAKRVAK
jgi:uncharacterized protein (DUF488 family)